MKGLNLDISGGAGRCGTEMRAVLCGAFALPECKEKLKNPKTASPRQNTARPRESPQFHESACRNISEFSRGGSAESADFQFPRAAPLKVPEIQSHGRFPKNGGSKERRQFLLWSFL